MSIPLAGPAMKAPLQVVVVFSGAGGVQVETASGVVLPIHHLEGQLPISIAPDLLQAAPGQARLVLVLGIVLQNLKGPHPIPRLILDVQAHQAGACGLIKEESVHGHAVVVVLVGDHPRRGGDVIRQGGILPLGEEEGEAPADPGGHSSAPQAESGGQGHPGHPTQGEASLGPGLLRQTLQGMLYPLVEGLRHRGQGMVFLHAKHAPFRVSRSWIRAVRRRLFTVPSGRRRREAISRVLNPSQ